MDDQDKSFLWMVIITSLFLVTGIVFAVVEKQDLSNYEAKPVQQY
jgi:hypothetical protein